MNMNSQSTGSKTEDTQLNAFPYYGSEGKPMTLGDIKKGKYPDDVNYRILQILKEFDINDENDSNFKFGVANLSDEDLDRLRRVQDQGLRINSENIFPLASTSLNNEEIGRLKEWQEKVYSENGVVIRTRENLFTLLNFGCTDDNVKKYKRKLESDKRKFENDKIINAMKNEVRKFFDDYMENNLIIRSDWPFEENNEYYESEEETQEYRDFFMLMLRKLYEGIEVDVQYSPNYLDFYIPKLDGYWKTLGGFVEEQFSCELKEYLENNNLQDAEKTYLEFIRDFPEIYFFGYKANDLRKGVSEDEASLFNWETVCCEYGKYKSENGDSSESFKDWLKINYSGKVNSYLDEHNDLSKKTVDYLRFIRDFPSIVYNKVDASDSRYLSFYDLDKDFDDQSLATLFFYLKITGKELLNGKDFYSCLESTIKNLNLDIKSLKFLCERGIYVDGSVISKITNESIDGVEEYLKNNEIDSNKILPIIIGFSRERKDVKKLNAEDSVKKYVSILETFGDCFSKVNHDYECMGMAKNLVNCDERMLNENNFKFILDNLIEKSENLIEDPKKFIDNYISYNKYIDAISLLSDGKFSAKFKEHFPDFTFSTDIIKKLVELDKRMFDENNLKFILENLIKENSENPFNDYISCNKYIGVISLLSDDNFFGEFKEHFPDLTFSTDIIKKLVELDKRMFDENNLKFILENLIKENSEELVKENPENLVPSDSKNSFDEYISYNEKIDKIDMIVKKGQLDTELLKLLSENFGIKGKQLVDHCEKISGFDYNKLKKLSDLIGEHFGSVHLKISDIDHLLKVDDEYDQLFELGSLARGNKGYSHLSDPNGDKLFNSFDRNQPYKSVEPSFTQEEDKRIKNLRIIDEYIEGQILELNERIDMLRERQKEYAKKFNEIYGSASRRHKDERKRENAQEEKRRQAILQSCKSFFNGGINEDNFKRIYDEFFDIVFDGKDNKFLRKIPREVINNTEFLTEVINLSLKNGTPHRTFYLYKYLNNDKSFETVYKIMSEESYFGSLIYGVSMYGENEEFYKYILGKYGEMPVFHKVKLLPYLSDIDFKSFDDFDKFLKEIIGKFGILCLEPHAEAIRKISNKFRGDRYSTYSRDYLVEKKGFHNGYLNACEARLYAPDFDIYSVYDRGSGEFLGNYESCKYQKFVLTGKVFDSQNIRFYFCTDDAEYHRYINHKGDYFGGGFLSLDDLDKKIYVYGYSADIGKVHTKLYPVIEDILNKEFPDYVVEFGNPNYYPN